MGHQITISDATIANEMTKHLSFTANANAVQAIVIFASTNTHLVGQSACWPITIFLFLLKLFSFQGSTRPCPIHQWCLQVLICACIHDFIDMTLSNVHFWFFCYCLVRWYALDTHRKDLNCKIMMRMLDVNPLQRYKMINLLYFFIGLTLSWCQSKEFWAVLQT